MFVIAGVCHTFAAVLKKWYVEFLIVLVMIGLAIVGVMNIDFTAKNKSPLPAGDEIKTDAPVSPEKAKWLAGQELFKANCVACHNISFDGVGPALKGVEARWTAAGPYQGKTGKEWMHVWIRNWNDVVKADYKYGVDMANSRPQQMNIFNWLSDKDIDNIMFYIESPDSNKPQR